MICLNDQEKENDEMDENNMPSTEEGKSCWNCGYQQIGCDTFLGKCTWFSKHNHERDKDIPPNIIDIGCKHFIML